MEHPPPLFYIAAIVAIFYFTYNLRRAFVARIGRAEHQRPGLIEMARNALTYGVGQYRVSSSHHPAATVLHLLLAWGFIELLFATTVDFFVARSWFVAYLPAKDTVWFAALNETGGLALGLGTLFALRRRSKRLRPELLPHAPLSRPGTFLGDTGILILLLVLVIGGFLTEAARLAIEVPASYWASFIAAPISLSLSVSTWTALQPWLWWTHALAALAFIAIIPQTKIFHSLMVIANTALTSVDKMTALRPMNIAALLEDPDADPDDFIMGAEKISDLSWKQLLDSQACTECARCSMACPATGTGHALSPMEIIRSIRHNLYAETLSDRPPAELHGGLITSDMLWACTTCGACSEECPVLVDHIPTIIELRRYLVLAEGQPPDEAGPVLEKMQQHGNPWGFQRAARLDWAKEANLDLPLMSDKKSVDVLFWVGCAGAYDPRNQIIARAMVGILQSAGIDFAVLGSEENCTGDAARRMGAENVYEELARLNLATFAKYQFRRIVTLCPHCLQTLGSDYRQLGGDFEVIHHTAFIEELLETGHIKVRPESAGAVVYHDPCYLGRHHGIYESPRTVLDLACGTTEGAGRIELELSRERGFCCGAGGGNMWYEAKGEKRINLERFDQVMAEKPDTLVTACSFCMIMMEDASKVRGQESDIAVKDLAELVYERLV